MSHSCFLCRCLERLLGVGDFGVFFYRLVWLLWFETLKWLLLLLKERERRETIADAIVAAIVGRVCDSKQL